MVATGLFCGLQVGHVLGMYKSCVKFLNSVCRSELLVSKAVGACAVVHKSNLGVD